MGPRARLDLSGPRAPSPLTSPLKAATTDVWLIGWATGQATELHDHGDSLGALTVVTGVLSERRRAPHRGGTRSRRLRAGGSQGF